MLFEQRKKKRSSNESFDTVCLCAVAHVNPHAIDNVSLTHCIYIYFFFLLAAYFFEEVDIEFSYTNTNSFDSVCLICANTSTLYRTYADTHWLWFLIAKVWNCMKTPNEWYCWLKVMLPLLLSYGAGAANMLACMSYVHSRLTFAMRASLKYKTLSMLRCMFSLLARPMRFCTFSWPRMHDMLLWSVSALHSSRLQWAGS